jgi:hypothetical protein
MIGLRAAIRFAGARAFAAVARSSVRLTGGRARTGPTTESTTGPIALSTRGLSVLDKGRRGTLQSLAEDGPGAL